MQSDIVPVWLMARLCLQVFTSQQCEEQQHSYQITVSFLLQPHGQKDPALMLMLGQNK